MPLVSVFDIPLKIEVGNRIIVFHSGLFRSFKFHLQLPLQLQLSLSSPVPILVKDQHIQKGIDTYQGVRDRQMESLFKNGNLQAEVYVFKDGRFLVKYLLLNKAFLFESKEELMNSVVLE